MNEMGDPFARHDDAEEKKADQPVVAEVKQDPFLRFADLNFERKKLVVKQYTNQAYLDETLGELKKLNNIIPIEDESERGMLAGRELPNILMRNKPGRQHIFLEPEKAKLSPVARLFPRKLSRIFIDTQMGSVVDFRQPQSSNIQAINNERTRRDEILMKRAVCVSENEQIDNRLREIDKEIKDLGYAVSLP